MPSKQLFRIGMVRDGATRMTCGEAGCVNTRNGWVTVLDPTDPKHVESAKYIKHDSGKQFTELRSEDAMDFIVSHAATLTADVESLKQVIGRTPPNMLVFIFPPGQQCFRPHLDREVMFVHDTPQRKIVHAAPRDFNEDFNIEADRIDRLIQRG